MAIQIKKIELVEELTIQPYGKHTQELVCYGFLRDIEQYLCDKQFIPEGIMQLCYKFYLNVGFIKFTNPGKIKNRIDNKYNERGELIQTIHNGGGKEAICYAKKGFKSTKIEKENVYEWSIECKHMSLNDMIGITSTLSNINDIEYAFNLNDTCHFWWAHDGIWQNAMQNTCSWNRRQSNSYSEWNSGDIVTVKLDIKNNNVVFLKNGEMVF
eukprot:UN09720